MKLTIQGLLIALTNLLILNESNASPGINPMTLSRNAISQSVRKVSFGDATSSSSYTTTAFPGDELYDNGYDDAIEASTVGDNDRDVQLCSATAMSSMSPLNSPLVKNLAKGAFLRVASDLSGGTALENIKCRVTATYDGPVEATRHLVTGGNGFWNLWSGTPSRTIEGALLGAVFLVGSTATKKQVLAMGAGKNVAATAGGIVGGIAQAVVMTPAGMIFTSLNVNKGKPGHENDTAMSVTRKILKEKGIAGMYIGSGPMAARQASNWASRGLFTEICRTNLKLSRFGLIGEIGSGAIGGIGSCWNTPIETVRVLMQKDVSQGIPPKTFDGYVESIVNDSGYTGLFRGVTPRAVQAIVQTCFMVVVPNLLGL
jgi:hypothetical protein